ncbi:Usher syndrome type-1G protein-like, partial [Scleropages formosus]
GDPDKCDLWGNAPLHLAAANGHLNCISFLVSFGANVWCLDNEYHTPLNAAAAHSRMDCVRYLDSVATRQMVLNPKLVVKLKERAMQAAQRRIQECLKVQRKQLRRQERRGHQREFKSNDVVGISSYARCGTLSHFGVSTTNISFSQATLHSTTKSKTKIQKKLERKKQADGSFLVSEDGRRSVRSLSGLQLGRDVMFLKQGTYAGTRETPSHLSIRNMFPFGNDAISRAMSDPGLHGVDLTGSEASADSGHESLFKRPGLGTVVFRRSYARAGDGTGDSLSTQLWGLQRSSSLDRSISSLQEHDLWEVPWDEADLDDDDDNDNYVTPKTAPLEAFLAAHGTSELLTMLCGEKIDLEALLLCSDSDLEGIDVPLGPRRKILEACRRRKETLEAPGGIQDTH